MVIVCGICRGHLDKSSPTGSTDLADRFMQMKTPASNRVSPLDSTAANDIRPLYANEPDIVACSCGHVFHNSCATEWFLTIGQRKCPICNSVTPVTHMFRIYPSTANDSDTDLTSSMVNGESLSQESASTSSRSTAPLSLGQSTQIPEDDVLENASEVASPPEEPIVSQSESSSAIQVTEAIVNGLRTMFYRFTNPGFISSTPRAPRERWRSNSRTHQENPDHSRSPRRCNNCSALRRVQILMERDLTTLRHCVAEQETTILTLTEVLNNKVPQRPPTNEDAGDSIIEVVNEPESSQNNDNQCS